MGLKCLPVSSFLSRANKKVRRRKPPPSAGRPGRSWRPETHSAVDRALKRRQIEKRGRAVRANIWSASLGSSSRVKNRVRVCVRACVSAWKSASSRCVDFQRICSNIKISRRRRSLYSCESCGQAPSQVLPDLRAEYVSLPLSLSLLFSFLSRSPFSPTLSFSLLFSLSSH